MKSLTIEVSHTFLPSLGSMTCRISTLSTVLRFFFFDVGVLALARFEVLPGAQSDSGGALGFCLLYGSLLEPRLEWCSAGGSGVDLLMSQIRDPQSALIFK